MKHASIIACVLAASVMPAAIAQSAEEASAKAYEIKVQGDALPAEVNTLEYPFMSASRGKSGACDLSVTVDDRGNIGAVRVKACSSSYFHEEAAKLARNDSASTQVAAVHPMRIEWSIED